MCTRQRLRARAHKLTIGYNVPMVYECTVCTCAHANAYAHTRTSSPLDRMCQWSTSAQHVHATTLVCIRAQAHHWTECANGLRVHIMCTRQRLCAHAYKLTIGHNVPMVYECTACAHDNACAHTRTSSPLDRMCHWSTSAQHVHTITLARTRAQAHHWTECVNGLRVHSMCTRQRLRAHAHKLTIGQNVPMVHECTACAYDNACAHTRTSSPLDRMCQWSTSTHAHKPFGKKVHVPTLSNREGPIWRARDIYSPVTLSLDHTRGPHPALRQGKLETPHPAKAGLSCPKPVAVRKRKSYTKDAFPLSERPCHRGMPRVQVCIRRNAIATYTTCLPTDHDSSPRARHSKRSAQQSTQTVSEL